MPTGKTIALSIQTFVRKSNVSAFEHTVYICHSFSSKERASFNFVAVVTIHGDLETRKIKSDSVSIFLPSICHEMIGPVDMILVFGYWVLSQLFHSLPSHSSGGALVPLCLLPLEWYYVCIWGCWYFSGQSWFQLVIHRVLHFAWCTLHRS